MAIRTAHNPFNLKLDVVVSAFAEKSPGRGRPQANSYCTVDLSGVKALCDVETEKRVRNEAFKLLRNHLAIDSDTPIVPHTKVDGAWIIKTRATGGNVHVKVSSETPAADVIFG